MRVNVKCFAANTQDPVAGISKAPSGTLNFVLLFMLLTLFYPCASLGWV